MHIPTKNIYIVYLLVILGSCSPKKGTNPVLQQAGSLLEVHLDSALTLLKSLPSPQQLSEADYAHYALLMTAATDKQGQSLIPCDSLINFALDYYDEDEKGKAIALLYRGRLLAEIGEIGEAIKCSIQVLEILDHYPKEIKSKRLIYNALGNWYIDNKLYDKALEVLYKDLDYADTELSKSIALNNLSDAYYGLYQEDSTLFFQKEALKHAFLSKDSSLILDCLNNLSLLFNTYEEYDSAKIYADELLLYLPNPDKGCEGYYYNRGDLFLTQGKLDSAKYYLEKSLVNSDLFQRSAPCRSLAYLEEELGNFENAYRYMEEYVNIADSLYDEKKMMEIGRLVYKHNAEMQIKNEQMKTRRNLQISIMIGITICFIVILIYQNLLNRRKRLQLHYEQSLKDMQYKQSVFKKEIEDHKSIIAFLQQQQKDTLKEIKQREQTINQLKEEKLKLLNWLFEQSEIYQRVYFLSQQNEIEAKQRKVMTTDELEKLQQTIFEIYKEYVSFLKKEHPRFTEKDILLLCLQKTKLTSRTIALCFGSVSTQAINQRKSRLKQKL